MTGMAGGAAIDARMRARLHAVRRERMRRRRRIVLSVVTLVLLVVSGVVLARSPLFAIQAVEVRGAPEAHVPEVLAAAAIRRQSNLLQADLGAAADRVERLPWVRAAQVRRIPPSTVAVVVTPRQPLAVVHLDDGAWLVDSDGVVLGGGTRPGLVTISAPRSVLPPVGARTVDAAVRAALTVHTHLPPTLRARVDRYDAPSVAGLRLRLAHDGRNVWVRFGAAEHIDQKAQVVEVLLAQLSEHAQEGATSHELDVRVPLNPVVIPNPPPRRGSRRANAPGATGQWRSELTL